MDARSDSLVEIPHDRWPEVKASFLGWWPHGVPGYYALETFIEHPDVRESFRIKLFCPYGKIENGVIAFSGKGALEEVIILTNSKDNSKLEEALSATNRVDWTKRICIPYADCDVVTIVKNISPRINIRILLEAATIKHFLDKNTKPFEHLNHPENTYIDKLKVEHIKQVDDPWPHRYRTSPRFFEVLIRNDMSYGLFSSLDHSLMAWVFINEVGFLTHLYVEEKHRKKGYAEYLMKYVSNDQLSKGKDLFCYVVENNIASLKLYRKLNYEVIGRGVWTFVSQDKNSNKDDSKL